MGDHCRARSRRRSLDLATATSTATSTMTDGGGTQGAMMPLPPPFGRDQDAVLHSSGCTWRSALEARSTRWTWRIGWFARGKRDRIPLVIAYAEAISEGEEPMILAFVGEIE